MTVQDAALDAYISRAKVSRRQRYFITVMGIYPLPNKSSLPRLNHRCPDHFALIFIPLTLHDILNEFTTFRRIESTHL